MGTEFATILLRCPLCGGALCVSPSGTSTSTSTGTEERTAAPPAPQFISPSTSTSTPPLLFDTALPARADRPAKASLWHRALAIAHRAIDEHAQDSESDQDDAFKVICAAQHVPYDERNLEGRPLYARAMEYARQQRRRRVGGLR